MKCYKFTVELFGTFYQYNLSNVMKRRLVPELAAAAIFAQLDFLPVSDERRYYQHSSLATNLHCSSIQGSPFLCVLVKGHHKLQGA